MARGLFFSLRRCFALVISMAVRRFFLRLNGTLFILKMGYISVDIFLSNGMQFQNFCVCLYNCLRARERAVAFVKVYTLEEINALYGNAAHALSR